MGSGTHEEIRNREDLNHKIGEIWDQKAALEIWIYGNGRRLQCIWPARKSKMEMRNAKNQSQDCQGMSFVIIKTKSCSQDRRSEISIFDYRVTKKGNYISWGLAILETREVGIGHM
ncbi:hypothetical protein Bca52824_002813 [Brassica carinata]|uniref:Uncharacterized protein n=1 Tax=Brassica carinata TaxID=52824 RepID=A0A8X7WP31_BRACI|nr:hypothetical protein Bca52824_002813 [Brassica carinata]